MKYEQLRQSLGQALCNMCWRPEVILVPMEVYFDFIDHFEQAQLVLNSHGVYEESGRLYFRGKRVLHYLSEREWLSLRNEWCARGCTLIELGADDLLRFVWWTDQGIQERVFHERS